MSRGTRGHGTRQWPTATGLALAVSLAGAAWADEAPGPVDVATSQEHGEAAEAEHEEPERLNTLALFLGNTHEEGENGFSVGLEYEREVAGFLGVGAIVERAGGEIQSTVAMFAFYLHPFAHLDVIVGLGYESKGAREDEHGEEQAAASGAMARLGLAYVIELGRFAIVPQVNVDVFERQGALVAGASFAYKF